MRNMFENSNEMMDNLSNEMEESKMTKLGLYESRTFGRISYGFVRDDKGMVYIKEDEAQIIRWMYKMCIQGLSLLQIQAELIRMGINSPMIISKKQLLFIRHRGIFPLKLIK